MMDASLVPSLPQNDKLRTFSYHSRPESIKEPVAMGVDEAGRGPVLGPMVYAVAYAPLSYLPELAKHGYDDSKVLNADVRLQHFQDLLQAPKRDCMGWATTVMTAVDIGDGMLRPDVAYNLNDQAHDTTMDLIRRVLASRIEIAELYVDTVGPPDKYQRKLSSAFPSIGKVVVTKKADSLYPVVSLASICAKVTRDLSLEDQLSNNPGSGYPSDPNTVQWLRDNMDKLFGWGPLVRYSWGTATKMLDTDGHQVTWKSTIDEGDKKKKLLLYGPPKKYKGLLPKVGMSMYGEPVKGPVVDLKSK